MTRAKISEYSATANDNTDVNGINIAEGCPPSSMNNMGREIMAALKRFQVGSDGDGVTVGGSLVVSGSTSVNTFNVDVISEKTSAAGVTIDGVLLKDSGVVTGAGTVSAPVYSTTGDLNTGIFFPAADTIAFAEGGAEAMRIDSSGNVGIGVTPSAWGGGQKSLQVLNASLSGFSNSAYVIANGFFDGSVNKYIATDFASQYVQVSGEHRWSTAPSGTAGNAITFTERARITSGGDFQFNSGFGSVATAYGCRAWVNFDGTGTPAIREDGNVSSITDNDTGLYTINMTTAMPDVNYSNVVTIGGGAGLFLVRDNADGAAKTTTTFRINCATIIGPADADAPQVNVAVFR